MIYLAGPYTSNKDGSSELHRNKAKHWSIQCMLNGIPFHCPHANTGGFEYSTVLQQAGIGYEEFMAMDFHIILRCDAIFLMPGWEKSGGARREKEYAEQHGIPTFEEFDNLKMFWDERKVGLHDIAIQPKWDETNPPREASPINHLRHQGMTMQHELNYGGPASGRLPSSVGVKFDTNKPRADLIPVFPLIQLASLYAIGAKKYADRNWEKGMDWSRPYGALLRHLWLWWEGEEYDKETKAHHLDAVAFNTFALREYVEKNTGKDNRPITAIRELDDIISQIDKTGSLK